MCGNGAPINTVRVTQVLVIALVACCAGVAGATALLTVALRDAAAAALLTVIPAVASGLLFRVHF